MLNVHGFTLDAPPEFDTEEMTVGLRKAAQNTSLIVQTKKVRAGATLDQLATDVTVELTQALPGMQNLARTALNFTDGGDGIALSYDWQTQAGLMRQYYVLRLQNDRLATVMVTVPRDGVTPESAGDLMRVILSLRPA